MIVIIFRTLIIFLTLMVVMRLMGKRQIGEMQPFEFIVTLIVADLACIPMADVSIPLIYGVVAILTLFFLHQLLSLLEQTGNVAKRIISGKPSVVLNKNGVDLAELKKNNMGVEDLIESMRSLGYFALDDLDYAIFEANGKLSAFEAVKAGTSDGDNADARRGNGDSDGSAAERNAEQNAQPSSLPLVIISDGKPIKKNIAAAGSDGESVSAFLRANGGVVKNTEVMTLDGNGRVYLKLKNKKFKILSFPMQGGVSW